MFNTNNLPENRRGLLRFWCQTVLPLVYDESLSYYELLCKITGYVNKLIEDVKNLETEVDALDGRVTVVETAVENLDGRVTVVETAVEALETNVENVKTNVENLGERVENVENAVENLETESERFVKSVYESYESAERVDLNNIENPSIISVKPSNTDNLPDDSDIMRYAGAMLTHNFEKNEKKHVLQLYLMSSTEPKMYARYKNFGEGAEAVGNWTEWYLISGGSGAGFELPEMASNLSDMTDKEKVYIYSVDYQLYKYDADSDSFAETGLYWALPPEFIMHPLPSKIVDALTPDYFNTMGVVRYETDEIPNSVGDLMIIKDTLGYIKQVAYGDDSTIYIRSYDVVAQKWSGWDSVTNDLSGYFHVMNNIAYDMNLNNTNGVYHIENVAPFLNIPEGLTGKCQLIVMGDETVERQTIITHDNNIYTRDNVANGNWGNWFDSLIVPRARYEMLYSMIDKITVNSIEITATFPIVKNGVTVINPAPGVLAVYGTATQDTEIDIPCYLDYHNASYYSTLFNGDDNFYSEFFTPSVFPHATDKEGDSHYISLGDAGDVFIRLHIKNGYSVNASLLPQTVTKYLLGNNYYSKYSPSSRRLYDMIKQLQNN